MVCESAADPYGVSTRGRLPNPATLTRAQAHSDRRRPMRPTGATAGGGPSTLSTLRCPYPPRRLQPPPAARVRRRFGRMAASRRASGGSGARGARSIPIESSSAVARSNSSARAASASGMRSGSSTTTVARRTAVRRAARRTMQSSAWPVSGSPNRTRTVPPSTARAALSMTAPGSPAVLDPRGRHEIGRRTARRGCAPGFGERRATRSPAATKSPSRCPVRFARTRRPSSASSKTAAGPIP